MIEKSRYRPAPQSELEEKLLGGFLFEARLQRAGLLNQLEEQGILPKVVNPNPHNPNMETEEHDRWWRNNPAAAQAYRQCVLEREDKLHLLNLGGKLTWLSG